MLLLLFKGMFLGFAIAAPVGPINLLCMRRSLRYGQATGLATGLGAAVADTLYGAVAAFGLTWISDWFLAYQGQLAVIGALIFFAIGVRVIRTPPLTEGEGDQVKPSAWKAFVTTILLTGSNPTTILSFLTAFAAVKLETSPSGRAGYVNALVATSGVFAGSTTWWVFISWLSSRFRNVLTPKLVHRINIGAGVLLFIFSGLIFYRGIRSFV